MSNILEIIKERRSIRKFQKKEIPKDIGCPAEKLSPRPIILKEKIIKFIK